MWCYFLGRAESSQKFLILVCGVLVFWGSSFLSVAFGDSQNYTTAYECPKADIFKNILTDIPFNAVMPITIGGAQVGGMLNRVPESASSDFLCACTDNFGVSDYGLVLGMWEVAYLIELVREPNCSPVLGITLPFGSSNIGSAGTGSADASDIAFYHAHLYSFPLFTMLNLFSDLSCGKSDYMDLDLLYASELDPGWNDELIALTQTPELPLLANKEMVTSCSRDALLSFNEGKTFDELFYCAGAWGFLYPLTGYTSGIGSIAENTSLLAVRLLALLHKRGLLKNTVGNNALCDNDYYSTLTKSMYRFSMLYPTPERGDNHALGEPGVNWQADMRVPPGNQSVIYVVWRYRNCCLRG